MRHYVIHPARNRVIGLQSAWDRFCGLGLGLRADCTKAAHTHTQLLGNHWLALNQIPLHESNLRSTYLIDSQELIERPISRTRAPIGRVQSGANVE